MSIRNTISPLNKTKSISVLQRVAAFCFVLLMISAEPIGAQVISTNGTVFITNSSGTQIAVGKVLNNSGSTFTNDGTLTTDTLDNAGTAQGNGLYNISSLLSNISVFTPGTSTVALTGSSAHALPAFTFYGLTLNNASGLTISGNVTVNGTLTLTSGNITTGANKLSIGASGSVSQTSGHIIGNLEKTIPAGSPAPTFEIGDALYYTPVNLVFASVTGSGTVTATTTAGDHPDIINSNITSTLSANRYWMLTNSGTTYTTVDATFNYNAADVDGGAAPLSFIVAQNSGSWSLPSVGTVTSTSTQATGLTALGDFLVGESALSANVTLATGGSAISADDTGSTWTTLTGPVYSEGASGNVQNGTIILNAPSGFIFDVGGVAPTVLVTRTAGGGAVTRNINNVAGGTSVAISGITTTTITFTVTDFSTTGVTNSLTWQNVRVRPTAGAPLATGQITKTGTSTMVGVTNGSTNFGTLIEVAGALNKLQVIVPGETADPSSPGGKTGTPTTQAAGSPFTFTVNATDKYWNIVNATNTIAITSSDGAPSLPSNAALVSGTADFNVTLNTAGTQTVTATSVLGPAATPNTSSNITVAAITITPATGASAVSADNFGTGTWTTLTGPVYGEANVGNVGTGTIILNVPSGFIFDAGGVAPTVLITGGGTAADNINNATSGTSASVTVSATQITFNVTDASAGGTPNTLTWQNVRIRPTAGAPLATGNITKTGTSTILGVNGATNFGTLTEVAGTMTKLVVTLPGQTFSSGSGNSGTVTAQTAGSSFTIASLTATDQYFNTTPSYTGAAKTIVYTGPAGSASTYTTSVDFTAGISTTTLTTTLTRAEVTTITATEGGSYGNASSNLTVNAGTVTKLQILAPGESADAGSATGKTSSPSAQTAGSSFNVTVNAVDVHWNIVSSVADVVGITSSDTYATLPANAALASGTQTFAVTFKTAGTKTVTASDITTPARTANTTPSITVNAGALNKLQVIVPGEVTDPGSPTGKTGTPANQGTSSPFNFTVNAVDANWNLVNATNTINITSSDGAASLPANENLVGGTKDFTITLNTVGGWTITATNAGGPAVTAGTSASIAVASITITPATGGSAISADNVNGAYTSLTGPLYGEAASGNVGIGTVVLDAPSGFIFDVGGVAPTVLVTRTGGSGGDARNINSAGDGASLAVTSVTTSQITFTVSSASNSGVTNSLTWQNVRVRPSLGTPLASGNITKSGTSAMTGVTSGATNFGTLTEVAGAMTKLVITLPGQTFTPGSGNSGTVTSQTVTTPFNISSITATDQFFNTVTSYAGLKTLVYGGPTGVPSYTTGVNFTAGVSTTTLTTTLNVIETTTLTATDGGSFGNASSSLSVLPITTTWDGGGDGTNWGSANNWSTDAVPNTFNHVNLTGANSITVNVAATTYDITLNSAALALSITTGNSLTVSHDYTQSNGTLNTTTTFPAVTGTVDITGGTVNYNASGTQTVASQIYHHVTINGSGTKQLAGIVTVNGNLSVASGNTLADSGFQITGNISNTLTLSSGATLALGGAGSGTTFPTLFTSLSLDAASTVTYASTSAQTIKAVNYGNLSSTSSGARTLQNSGTIGIAGTFTAGTNSYTITGSTIEYNSTGAQNVADFDYNNITISGSGTSTLLGNVIVNGDLTISGGTFDLTSFTANRFSAGGTLTIAATCTLRIGGIGTSLPTNYTTHLFDPASRIEYYGTGQSIPAGTYDNLVVSGGGTTITLSANVDVVGDLTITDGTLDLSSFTANRTSPGGTLSVGSGGTLRIAGTNGLPTDYTTYTLDPASTVEFYGTDQPIAALSYGNLTVSASGTLTLANSGTIGIAGTFTPGGGTYVTIGSTINYNGSGAQTIGAINYNNLSLSTSGVKTFTSSTTSIAGTLSVSGATPDATTNLSTLEYNGTGAQTVTSMTYHHLTFTNAGLKTVTGFVTANGNMVVNTDSNVEINGTLLIHGNLDNEGYITNNGTFTLTP